LNSLPESQKNEAKICINKILVPIDGSSNSMRAAKYAIEVAKLQNAQIICVYVIAQLPYDYVHEVPSISGPAVEQYFENMKEKSSAWFNTIIEMAEQADVHNIQTDIVVDVLSIADAILYYAKDKSIDLIVIGATGKNSIERFLLGSVANNVLKHAHCPVMVAR